MVLQAVFDVDRKAGKLTLTEIAPGITIDELRAKTDAKFDLADTVIEMRQ